MHRRSWAGFSLIELMVVIAIAAFMLLMTARAFGGWSANARARSTAESLLNALRVTQASAVAHNRVAAFVLTAGTPVTDATPSASGSNWLLKIVPMSGSDETPSSLALIQSATVARQYGVTLQASSATGSTASQVCFSSLGQLAAVTASASNGLSVDCAPPTDGTPVTYTVSLSNADRQFKVLAYPGGQMRMCDAAKTLSDTNPDGCP